jgi:hypothetical protein
MVFQSVMLHALVSWLLEMLRLGGTVAVSSRLQLSGMQHSVLCAECCCTHAVQQVTELCW